MREQRSLIELIDECTRIRMERSLLAAEALDAIGAHSHKLRTKLNKLEWRLLEVANEVRARLRGFI
jgi:hypothetical protein